MTIEGKLIAHDRHQFELKLGYTLDPEKFHNKYKIELYFFIPKSLGVNPQTYSKGNFFNDIQGYLRFRTPRFTFEELVDANNPKSPLTRIKLILEKGTDSKKLHTELKLFACTMRVALRNSIEAIRRRIRKNDTEDLKKMVVEMNKGLGSCLISFRALNSKLGTNLNYRNVDEFLGIVVDELLNSLNSSILNSSLDTPRINELSGMISPLILAEFSYRIAHGYVTYSQKSENELFLYRKSILKKTITSPLFLETHMQEGLFYLKDFIFAMAAGAAMVIFVMVSLWAGRKWSASSVPFALALVFGYIIKDRIKDWFKFIFSKQMTKYLSDYKTIICDPESDDDIGVCRHAFSFISESKVPDDILYLRKGHIKPGDFWMPEHVIKYEKEVTVKPGPILRAHSRLGDITDIIRFNIHKFLERMDDPYEVHRAFDQTAENIVDYKCARVYHVNIVLKLSEQIHRIRLIMDKNGLKRIEEVKL